MKTAEFKLNLDSKQTSLIDSWLESLRWVWNEGLSLLLEYHHHKYYDWLEHKGFGNEYRRCYLKFSAKNAFAASCTIATGKSDNLRPCQPTIVTTARLKSDNFIGLSGQITKSRYSHRKELEAIPSKFIAGTLKHLAESWKAYKDKKRGNSYLPKFKSKIRGDKISSLYCIQPESIKVLNHSVKSPGSKLLGALKVVNQNLKKRWDFSKQPRTLQILKKSSGYYLQLSYKTEDKPLKRSNKACGIDVGLQYVYSDDAGKQIIPPRYYRFYLDRLRRFQRKLSRQVKNSQNYQKTKRKIALLHEKIRRQRRAFNHKLSTYLVRTFDAIAVEDLKISNLNRRPKPKKRENASGWERNNAKAKSGLNKSFADAGLGQLLEMIESKAIAGKREFERVKPHYTSQDCPNCHHRQKKALSQRTHRCTNCGFTTPRDIASSICIKAKASFARRYPTLMGKFKSLKEGDKPSVQEKSTLVESGCDAATIKPARENRCAEGQVYPNSSANNSSQKLMVQALQGVLPLGEYRELDRAKDTAISIKKRKPKNDQTSSTAQMSLAIQLELDFEESG